MRRIDVVEITNTGTVNEYTFRSNNDGCYLFIGVSENRQISHESVFQSLRRMKSAIREYLRRGHDFDLHGSYPRLKFKPDSSYWTK